MEIDDILIQLIQKEAMQGGDGMERTVPFGHDSRLMPPPAPLVMSEADNSAARPRSIESRTRETKSPRVRVRCDHAPHSCLLQNP